MNAQEKAEQEVDLEAGNGGAGAPHREARWNLLGKVYLTLDVHLLFTAAIFAVLRQPTHRFLLASHANASPVVLVATYLSSILLSWPTFYFRRTHPLNICFFVLYSLCTTAAIGLGFSYYYFTANFHILAGAFLTPAVVACATLFAFWAARRGHRFSLTPQCLLLAVSLQGISYYALVLLLHQWRPAGMVVYQILAAITFSLVVIRDTNNLIDCRTYDECVVPACGLYLAVINLFVLAGPLALQSACTGMLAMQTCYEPFVFAFNLMRNIPNKPRKFYRSR